MDMNTNIPTENVTNKYCKCYNTQKFITSRGILTSKNMRILIPIYVMKTHCPQFIKHKIVEKA